jgi:ABC-type branched-subunit amino acid transport system substrate-binding protein
LLAACGSSSHSSSSGTTATTSGATGATTATSATGNTAASGATSSANGSPLNILTLASVNYSGPTYANILTTAKIAGEWINAHGGVQGHPVKVTTCDEQGDPAKTAQCGRQAIADHDVAVVGSFTFNGSAIIPELAAAQTSWFGICCAASADELTSPDVQQIGSTGAYASALAVKAVVDGCKHMAVVLLNVGAVDTLTELLVKNALKSMNASGILAKTVLVPVTAQDYSSEVAEATSGTDCILAGLGQANFPSFMQPFQASGAHQRLYGPQGNLDITVTKPFPKATENAVIGGAYSDISLPAWANYRAALQQYNAPSNENYNSLGGLGTWAAYMAFVQVADSIKGPINNQTFLAAAQKASINLPGVPPANFADKFTALGGSFLNDVSRDITFDVVHNGVPVGFDGGKFFDMTNAMLGTPLPAAAVPPAGQSS